jgi:hypothetical protein
MSRYTQHKNGLVIGWDNMFFVLDTTIDEHNGEPPVELPEGVEATRDGYYALLSVESYYFDTNSTLTVFLRTPAQQLIWEEREIKWTRVWEHDGKAIDLPHTRRYNAVSWWAERWLNENVGARYDMWDTYTRGARSSGNLFFKRRKDALAFVKAVNKILAGVRIGLH